MNLYLTPSGYVRTQAEAKKLGGTGEVTDVPSTSKDGMIEFLNAHLPKITDADQARATVSVTFDEIRPENFIKAFGEPEHIFDTPLERLHPAERPKPMGAVEVLSRMDSPGVDVEACVEHIAKAKGYALKRYAGAVAVRFQELAGA